MLNHAQIALLVPHHGAMCLLDSAESWSESRILCHATNHLDPANPLRRNGRLGMICGAEYGFQAAALHGALCAGGIAQPAGYVAALRLAHQAQAYLDDPSLGTLCVEAELSAASVAGLVYEFRLLCAAGTLLLAGRGTIKLPPVAGPP